MCGIVGTVNIPLTDKHISLIKHRGPDGAAIERFELGANVVHLGHTRLMILELTDAGAQPMTSDDGNYAITFNGEIYNHADLRKRVPDFNYRGHSDSESILNLISVYGPECFKDLNGIFAFAFLDKQNGKLYLVRDPFGVKPIYYAKYGEQVCFSSELAPILESMPQSEIDVQKMYTFLKLRFNPSPQTLFKNIYKLEPGHYIEFDLRDGVRMGVPTFYSYLPKKDTKSSKGDLLEEYDQRLHKAINGQLQSDVPISILLSGGVDSGLLAHIATKECGKTFDSYTAGYQMQTDSNEIEEARITAEFVGSKHHPVYLDENDFFENLAHFIKIVEEPLASPSMVPMYYLSKKIHEAGYKVALSGQGVDELWGGYPKYNFQHLFDRAPNDFLNNFSFLKSRFKQDKIRRGLNSIMEADRMKRFIETCSVFDSGFLKNIMRNIGHEEHDLAVEQTFRYRFDYMHLDDFEASDALMFFDTRTSLSDALLMYTDKIAMHHALEVRVPFLDVELARFVESIPHFYKVDMIRNKKLHKKLSERYLPKSIIYRKKKHFQLPIKEWFTSDLGHRFETLMMENTGMFADVFDKPSIQSLFSAHRARKVNYEKQLFVLICMYYWLKIFVDNKGR